MENKRSLIVNLFSGPGVGKSTLSAKLFADFKESGYLVEMATEYVKDMVWQESMNVLKNQIYLFGKQHHRIWRLNGKVDIIFTDSPVIQGLAYSNMSSTFKKLCKEEHDKTWSLNILLERVHRFETEGRNHSEKEAVSIDYKIAKIVNKYCEDVLVYSNKKDDYLNLVTTIKNVYELNR